MTGSPHFVSPTPDQWTPTDPGVRRRILTYTANLMVVEFSFEKDAVGKIHSHPHEQASYVADGAFVVTIDGRSQILRKGDSFIVPSSAVHGVRALEAGLLVDSFTPAREDFLDAG